ncbi:SRPBCC family protein [Leucobacter triazinivorans]|uniref:Activator of Hsp90 ATPase homologue 1/2-like C-terminal domain-containing protein n=1 Tax=Leucobacter triazinivorans TaxID=1784719 RepID=A0A4P6KGH1_9MICO|nr:SRPBCC domain-containing protein [Leucobacter triazinivorans]QBE48574.1 hypothetical protein EVS81_06780 [Leucobacter triazinivorans]
MIPLGPVVARSRVKAVRPDVWSYLAEPARRAAWWPQLQLETGVGGGIAVRGGEDSGASAEGQPDGAPAVEGTVDVWVEGHALGFTWRESGSERGTAVLMTLRSQGGETGVTITETGFDALAAPADRAAAAQRDWQELLSGLAAAVDQHRAETIADGEGAEAAEGPVAEGPADTATREPAGDAPESGAQRDEDPGADTAGELEVAPEAVDGEVDDEDGSEVEIVEVDAEPQVGDRLEIDTGSVPVVETEDPQLPADSDSGAFRGVGAEWVAEDHDTVEVQRLQDPEAAEDPEAAKDPETSDASKASNEPDFDTLIRGA